MAVDVQSLLQECESTISQINSQLEKIPAQEQHHPELREHLELKKRILGNIEQLVRKDEEGIKAHLNDEMAHFLKRFKHLLDTISRILFKLDINSLEPLLYYLKEEYSNLIEYDRELQELLELRKKNQENPHKPFEEEDYEVFRIMQKEFIDLPDYLKNTLFSQQGVYLFTLLDHMKEGDYNFFEDILFYGFAKGIFEVKSIIQLSSSELLQVISQFVNLRRYCQNDGIYVDILLQGFANGIFKVDSIKQLSSSELLQIIPKFGEQFTNLQEFIQDDEIRTNIFQYGFAEGVFQVECVKKSFPSDLLQIISELINLRNSCQSDETFKNILKEGFVYGIFQVECVKKLSSIELLQVIQEFINLRNSCQSDEKYEDILLCRFGEEILQIVSIRKLSFPQLLQVIQEFINLRKYCQNDEAYDSILFDGFLDRIFENENIKQLSFENFLQIINNIISIASTSTNNTPQRIIAIITLFLYDIEPEELSSYFKNHIKDSKDKSSLLQQIPINPNIILKKIVHYIIKYQPKQLVKVAKEISLIQQLNLDTTIRFLEFNLTPLTEMNEEQLQITLSRNNQTQEINVVTFYKNYCDPNSRELQKFENILNQINLNNPREHYYGELVNLTQMIYEKVFINLKKVINTQIESKFREEFNLENLENFDNSLCDELFMEVYKMYSSHRLTHNKAQIRELLINYLNQNCYPQNKKVLKSYPYSHPINQEWIVSFFGSGFLNNLKARRWFSENRQEFKILESMDPASKESELNKYLQEIRNNLARNGISSIQISTYEQVSIYFEENKKNELRKLFNDENEYIDLIIQINSIQRLYNGPTNTKTLTKISIYHELNPLSVVLMGNRVDGSCLSFYHGVNNYYSAFSNAIDANKFVFYITDERGGIIARVLCAINTSGELVRFRTYSKNNIHITYNLDFNFNKYIQNLCRIFGITISNMDSNENDFEKLVCEEWYWENNYVEN